jgi:hypothetical protein
MPGYGGAHRERLSEVLSHEKCDPQQRLRTVVALLLLLHLLPLPPLDRNSTAPAATTVAAPAATAVATAAAVPSAVRGLGGCGHGDSSRRRRRLCAGTAGIAGIAAIVSHRRAGLRAPPLSREPHHRDWRVRQSGRDAPGARDREGEGGEVR